MTFRQIHRARPEAHQPFCATPPNTIRLAQQFTPKTKAGVRKGTVLVIWIGKDIAESVGLTELRYPVELLSDASQTMIRIAFRIAPAGEFRASRRGQSYCIYVDAATTTQLFGTRHLFKVLPPSSVEITGNMVIFTMPEEFVA